MRLSAFDLAYTYFTYYSDSDRIQDPAYRKQIFTLINNRLDQGWTAEDLLSVFADKSYKPKAGNLLQSNVFYYHNALRLYPGPPRTRVDYNTGTIERITEDYYLELKASFTIEDMLDYYLTQTGLNIAQINRNRYLGIFRYLIKQYDIDLLLFMIDCAVNHYLSEDMGPLPDPLAVTEYAPNALRMLNLKQTEERTMGVDRVVPRKRISLGGSGGVGSAGPGGFSPESDATT